MLRVRCRAAQCVRELTQRKSCGASVAAVRALTDGGQQAPTAPAGWHEQAGPAFHLAATTAAAAAAATASPAPVSRDSAQLGKEHGPGLEVPEGPVEPRSGDDKLPDESPAEVTPEEELVSKLKKIRSNSGPIGAGHLTKAMQMLTKARREGVYDITAYNIVIRMIGMEQWINKQLTEMVEDLMAKLREDGLVPNIYTYNGVLLVYAQTRALSKAKRVYKEMLAEGVEPNVLTLSHLVMAQAWGSSKDMYSTLAEMDSKGWTPTRGAQLCAIASMWQRKDAKGVLQMMQRMLEKNFQPTEAAFAVALMSAGRLGRADFAKVLFDWRHASGLGPKQEIYSSMMLAHSKADLHEETLGYWRQLVCLDGVGQVMIDPPTCTSALKSAVACNEWDEAETIADMLKLRPAEHTYKVAIAACRARSGADRADYAERVERAVETLRRAGLAPPSPEVLCRVAMACAHGNAWVKAAAIFEQALDQNVEMWAFRWECVIRTYFALERFLDVKDTWKRSNTKRGDLHTVIGNELAMKAALRLRDGDWAKEIMSVPDNNNTKKGLNPATLLIAVNVLAETDRLDEAREMLKNWTPSKTTRINRTNFNELLLSCEKYGGSDLLLEFYQILRQHDSLSRLQPATFAFVVGAFCEQGRAGEVVSFFEEQLAAGYRPERACYEVVARGASEAGDEEASVRFFEAAQQEAPAATDEEAGVALAEGGRERKIDGVVGAASDGGAGDAAAAVPHGGRRMPAGAAAAPEAAGPGGGESSAAAASKASFGKPS